MVCVVRVVLWVVLCFWVVGVGLGCKVFELWACGLWVVGCGCGCGCFFGRVGPKGGQKANQKDYFVEPLSAHTAPGGEGRGTRKSTTNMKKRKRKGKEPKSLFL